MHTGTQTTLALTLPTGEVINTCKDFHYLGVEVSSPDALIANRRALAWKAAHIFKSSASDTTKVSLFCATVEPVFLYGLDTIPMTVSRELHINASYRRMLRFALNIRFPAIISNVALLNRAGVPDFAITLQQKRLKLLGHTLRNDVQRRNTALLSTPFALTLRHPSH